MAARCAFASTSPFPAPGREWFTLREAARLLRMRQTASVGTAVARNRLPAEGNGKARRFPTPPFKLCKTVKGWTERADDQRLPSASQVLWPLDGEGPPHGRQPFCHLEGGNEGLTGTTTGASWRLTSCVECWPARDGDRSYRGLTGPDRYTLYATACGTGFRASALASLTLESFDLTTNQPVVILPARHDEEP